MSVLELFTATPVWASAAAVEHPTPPISDVIFPALNFLIYVFIIVKFALPVVRSFLRSRRDEVLGAITQASAKKQQAEALVRDYKARLAGVDQATQAIQGALREEGERERDKLLSEAQSLAVKIKDDAQFLAQQEVKMARQKIREEMANHAEATARKLVQSNLTAADQGRLVQDFIQDIGQAR
ncbi:MAG: hypothetical protein ACREQO_12515 [Candidatus Binatia bacterium]